MKREAKIGIFAIVMMGCAWAGIRFLSGIDIFSRNTVYYAAYPSVDGIQAATPITVQGVKVGTVTEIQFDPSVRREVVLTLMIRRSCRIPANSVARIYNESLMGGKAIAVELGDSPRYLEKNDTIRSERTEDFLAMAGTEITDLKGRLTDLMEHMTQTLDGLTAVLVDNKDNIDGTLTHLHSISDHADRLLAAERGDLERMIAHMERFSRALGDNAGRIDTMIGNLDRFSGQLADAQVDRLSDSLRTTLGRLDAALARIESGEGTVGRLMQDPALYESLEKASANLAALLGDLKEHPGRYVHFSLFGRKDKTDKAKARKGGSDGTAANE